MKKIINWNKASVLDTETNGFLAEVNKFHIVGRQLGGNESVTYLAGSDLKRIEKMLTYHIENSIPIVAHNGVCYDVPVFEKLLGMDLSKLMVIDTLHLSWYLNIDHAKHSIESLSNDYDTGIQKFFVDPDDWENLPWEDAVARVTADVKLNKIIWEDFKCRLINMATLAKTEIDAGAVGGKRAYDGEEVYLDSLVGLSVEDHVNRILTFLMFKADCQRLQEKTKWQVDIPYITENIANFSDIVEQSAKELESVMPQVANYSHRKQPAKQFKKNGELSVGGQKWEDLKEALKRGAVDEYGNKLVAIKKEGFISEITSYDPPNINSHTQVKDFLTSHGWIPCTFKTVRDKAAFSEWINARPQEGADRSQWTQWKDDRPEDRLVPQVREEGEDGKELCDSVLELAEEVPAINALAEYSVIKHRLDTLKGILNRVDSDGKVEASCHGFTNTLRLKHKAPIVNLPAASKKYAEPIRGSLIAPDGYTLVNSDLSSLEDRVKVMFMTPHDPDYAEAMSKEDYDPHLTTAVAMGTITKEQMDGYVADTLSPEERHSVGIKRNEAKPVNYLSVYGGTYKALMIQTGWDEGRCKDAIEAYWELNYSVKEIAKEQVVVTCNKNRTWLVNPINGFCYSVRSEKDYFSTLAQGTGSFLFDMWVDNLLTDMENRFKGNKTLTASVHDEMTLCVKDDKNVVSLFTGMLHSAINKVSVDFKLRRSLGCSVDSGKRYSEIH